jgi:hypothetical protein
MGEIKSKVSMKKNQRHFGVKKHENTILMTTFCHLVVRTWSFKFIFYTSIAVFDIKYTLLLIFNTGNYPGRKVNFIKNYIFEKNKTQIA